MSQYPAAHLIKFAILSHCIWFSCVLYIPRFELHAQFLCFLCFSLMLRCVGGHFSDLPESEAAELQNKLEVLNNIMDQEVSS